MTLTNISAGTPRTGQMNQNELNNDRVGTSSQVGRLGGHTVQQAATAHAPAARSGIGSAIANFFTATLPDFFSMAGNAVLSLFRPAPQAAPVPQAAPAPRAAARAVPQARPAQTELKPISKYAYPGDCFDKNYLTPSKNVARGAVYATVAHFASSTAASVAAGTGGANNARGAFLRASDLATNNVAVIEGAPLAADIRDIVLDAYAEKGPIAFLSQSYEPDRSFYQVIKDKDKGGNYKLGIDVDAAARDAVATAENVYEKIFGTPGDQSSIKAAANRVPQGLCDALAIALKAVDDADFSDDALKTEMKEKIGADMIALRVLNPTLATAAMQPLPNGDPMGNTMARNLTELSKFVQNIANGVAMGSKEPIHLSVAQALADNNTEAKLQATYKEFIAFVAERADPAVVAAAVTDGVRMAADFDAEQVRQGKALSSASVSGNDAGSTLSNDLDPLAIGTDGTFIPMDKDEDIFNSPFADDQSVSNDEDIRKSPFA